jgi:hypothetical protein
MADAVVAKVAHPNRRMLRTLIAGLPAAIATVPLIISALDIDSDKQPGAYALAAGALAVTAVLTRLLAIPQIEAFLQRSMKWLAASDIATEDVVSVVPEAIQGGDVIPGEVVAVAADASPLPNGTPVDVTETDPPL